MTTMMMKSVIKISRRTMGKENYVSRWQNTPPPTKRFSFLEEDFSISPDDMRTQHEHHFNAFKYFGSMNLYSVQRKA